MGIGEMTTRPHGSGNPTTDSHRNDLLMRIAANIMRVQSFFPVLFSPSGRVEEEGPWLPTGVVKVIFSAKYQAVLPGETYWSLVDQMKRANIIRQTTIRGRVGLFFRVAKKHRKRIDRGLSEPSITAEQAKQIIRDDGEFQPLNEPRAATPREPPSAIPPAPDPEPPPTAPGPTPAAAAAGPDPSLPAAPTRARGVTPVHIANARATRPPEALLEATANLWWTSCRVSGSIEGGIITNTLAEAVLARTGSAPDLMRRLRMGGYTRPVGNKQVATSFDGMARLIAHNQQPSITDAVIQRIIMDAGLTPRAIGSGPAVPTTPRTSSGGRKGGTSRPPAPRSTSATRSRQPREPTLSNQQIRILSMLAAAHRILTALGWEHGVTKSSCMALERKIGYTNGNRQRERLEIIDRAESDTHTADGVDYELWKPLNQDKERLRSPGLSDEEIGETLQKHALYAHLFADPEPAPAPEGEEPEEDPAPPAPEPEAHEPAVEEEPTLPTPDPAPQPEPAEAEEPVQTDSSPITVAREAEEPAAEPQDELATPEAPTGAEQEPDLDAPTQPTVGPRSPTLIRLIVLSLEGHIAASPAWEGAIPPNVSTRILRSAGTPSAPGSTEAWREHHLHLNGLLDRNDDDEWIVTNAGTNYVRWHRQQETIPADDTLPQESAGASPTAPEPEPEEEEADVTQDTDDHVDAPEPDDTDAPSATAPPKPTRKPPSPALAVTLSLTIAAHRILCAHGWTDGVETLVIQRMTTADPKVSAPGAQIRRSNLKRRGWLNMVPIPRDSRCRSLYTPTEDCEGVNLPDPALTDDEIIGILRRSDIHGPLFEEEDAPDPPAAPEPPEPEVHVASTPSALPFSSEILPAVVTVLAAHHAAELDKGRALTSDESDTVLQGHISSPNKKARSEWRRSRLAHNGLMDSQDDPDRVGGRAKVWHVTEAGIAFYRASRSEAERAEDPSAPAAPAPEPSLADTTTPRPEPALMPIGWTISPETFAAIVNVLQALRATATSSETAVTAAELDDLLVIHTTCRTPATRRGWRRRHLTDRGLVESRKDPDNQLPKAKVWWISEAGIAFLDQHRSGEASAEEPPPSAPTEDSAPPVGPTNPAILEAVLAVLAHMSRVAPTEAQAIPGSALDVALAAHTASPSAASRRAWRYRHLVKFDLMESRPDPDGGRHAKLWWISDAGTALIEHHRSTDAVAPTEPPVLPPVEEPAPADPTPTAPRQRPRLSNRKKAVLALLMQAHRLLTDLGWTDGVHSHACSQMERAAGIQQSTGKKRRSDLRGDGYVDRRPVSDNPSNGSYWFPVDCDSVELPETEVTDEQALRILQDTLYHADLFVDEEEEDETSPPAEPAAPAEEPEPEEDAPEQADDPPAEPAQPGDEPEPDSEDPADLAEADAPEEPEPEPEAFDEEPGALDEPEPEAPDAAAPAEEEPETEPVAPAKFPRNLRIATLVAAVLEAHLAAEEEKGGPLTSTEQATAMEPTGTPTGSGPSMSWRSRNLTPHGFMDTEPDPSCRPQGKLWSVSVTGKQFLRWFRSLEDGEFAALVTEPGEEPAPSAMEAEPTPPHVRIDLVIEALTAHARAEAASGGPLISRDSNTTLASAGVQGKASQVAAWRTIHLKNPGYIDCSELDPDVPGVRQFQWWVTPKGQQYVQANAPIAEAPAPVAVPAPITDPDPEPALRATAVTVADAAEGATDLLGMQFDALQSLGARLSEKQARLAALDREREALERDIETDTQAIAALRATIATNVDA